MKDRNLKISVMNMNLLKKLSSRKDTLISNVGTLIEKIEVSNKNLGKLLAEIATSNKNQTKSSEVSRNTNNDINTDAFS
jgi:hypothetical protein